MGQYYITMNDVTTTTTFLTRQQVAKLLNISMVTLDTYRREGKIKAYGIGKRILFKYSDVMDAVKPLEPITE